MFEGQARLTYREKLAVDDATWARARAWVMLPALAGIRYYEKTMPAFSRRSQRHLDAVLGDVGVQTPGGAVDTGIDATRPVWPL